MTSYHVLVLDGEHAEAEFACMNFIIGVFCVTIRLTAEFAALIKSSGEIIQPVVTSSAFQKLTETLPCIIEHQKGIFNNETMHKHMHAEIFLPP